MSDDLMSLPLKDLLRKFAAGSHKPGSGSAAALLALISAALSKTVIALTVDRERYAAVKDELVDIANEIETEIEPKLEKAFVDDSLQFGKVIEARKLRDKSESQADWWRRSHDALNELDVASRIALSIAKKSVRLTELSLLVFDKGFQSARGDSEVAIEAALSGATGAISVVYLNLKDFRGESYAKEVLEEASDLADKAEKLQIELRKRMEKLKERAVRENQFLTLNAPKILLKRKKKSRYTKDEITDIARNVQSELWLNRSDIWPSEELLPFEIIDPATTFRLHGYEFETAASLGTEVVDGEDIEVAGFVDIENRIARISTRFSQPIQRFTSAHELGHALLHEGTTLFRDRALEGGPVSGPRPQIEKEADIFAAAFLMPAKQIQDIFTRIFGVDSFEVNQDSAYALGFKRLSEFENHISTPRRLSTHLATVQLYAGKATRSLTDVFGVSPSAMAIRLEELELVS